MIFFANLPFFSCNEEELLEIKLIEAVDGVEGGEYGEYGEYGEGLTVEVWSQWGGEGGEAQPANYTGDVSSDKLIFYWLTFLLISN